MPAMRAKFVLRQVNRQPGSDSLKFNAVSRSDRYPDDGSDENNTYAHFSPSAECLIVVANPALIGKFEPGTEFYVDFTPVKPPEAEQPAA